MATATTASAASLVLLALLTINVQAANTCLAYRLAHLRARHTQWGEYVRRLECRVATQASPANLALALGERARLLQPGLGAGRLREAIAMNAVE